MLQLLEDNEYEFRVAAENKAGIGEFSAPSESILAKNPWTLPGKPGRPEASNVTGFTADLTWTAPESDGGAEITHYLMQYRPKGSDKWIDYNSQEKIPGLNHTAGNLKENTEYEFRVAAENKAGVGPWSDPSEPVKTPIGKSSTFQPLLKKLF